MGFGSQQFDATILLDEKHVRILRLFTLPTESSLSSMLAVVGSCGLLWTVVGSCGLDSQTFHFGNRN
jgi:hypothetical protein